MKIGKIQNTTQIKLLSKKWDILPFNRVLKDSSGGNKKIKKGDLFQYGKLAVVDQGKEFIAGYTNNLNSEVKSKTPLIVFGDHTRNLKYIDFPFAMGADGTKILEVIHSDCDVKYLYYYLTSLNIIDTGYNRHFKFIKDLVFPVPPLKTQKQIASILDDAQALKQKTEQLLKEYDELAQSIFLDMFGDTWANPNNYPVKLIEELASEEKHSIKAGPFGSSLKKEFYTESGYKIYGQEQVIRDDLSFGNYYIDEKRFQSLKNCQVKEGDILISLVGTYGKISVVPNKYEKGIINPRLMKISPNKSIIRPDFLKVLLQSEGVTFQLRNQSRGGTMDIVNVGIIRKVKTILPPIKLQNQFAEKIKLIEQQKELAKQELKESEDLFQALLQKAFKGELN